MKRILEVAAPKPLDDSKIMDISKPGKTKPVATSRPVITTHPTLGKEPDATSKTVEVSDKAVDVTKAPDVVAPSQSRKVIAPISIEVSENGEVVAKEDPAGGSEPKAEADTTEAIMAAVKDQTTPEPTVEAAKPVDSTPEAIPPTSDTPAESESESPPEPPKEADKPADDMGSDAAGVDALADTVATKKQSEKEAEELAKRDAAIQELITSKKYFVPLAHDSTKKPTSKAPGIILLLILIIAVAGYALVDLGTIDLGFDVPYHILKK